MYESSAGKFEDLFDWFKELKDVGNGYGYLVNEKKSWLIVKSDEAAERARIIFGNTVNITADGKHHLGAALGSLEYKASYCNDLINSWLDQLNTLSEFSISQPQAAFAVFTKGFKSKFTHFFRSIIGFEDFVEPLENFITEKLLPNLFGFPESCLPEGLRPIFFLWGFKIGGLGFLSFVMKQKSNAAIQK